MIELSDVDVCVEEKTLLSNINLRLDECRIAIIGGNGSGKSTFARLLNGLLLPTNGNVVVDGLNTRNDGAAVRRKVGFVFQNPDNQIVFPTVAEDLAFGLKNIGVKKGEISTRIDSILKEYDLDNFHHRLVHQLSGGEKQLVAIAGVMIMSPELLVFDEPTTLLDLGNQRRIGRVIDSLSQQVILVTHDLDAIRHFDRVLCFASGRIVADGDPAEVIAHYIQQFDD